RTPYVLRKSRSTSDCCQNAISGSAASQRFLGLAVGWDQLFGDRVSPRYQRPSKTLILHSADVETTKVHHLVPGRDEVVDELLLSIGTSVDFRQCAELRVRTKDEVDTRAGPLQFACFAIASFKQVCVFRHC